MVSFIMSFMATPYSSSYVQDTVLSDPLINVVVTLYSYSYVCYTVSGETPEQRLENALTTMNQQRTVKYGGMTPQQFQAVQEKRKQLWKKKVSHSHLLFRHLVCILKFL